MGSLIIGYILSKSGVLLEMHVEIKDLKVFLEGDLLDMAEKPWEGSRKWVYYFCAFYFPMYAHVKSRGGNTSI